MTTLLARLAFDTRIPIRDIKRFESFILLHGEDIQALNLFGHPNKAFTFQKHETIYEIFFDYVKGRHEKIVFKKTVKKNPLYKVGKKIPEGITTEEKTFIEKIGGKIL